MEALLMLARLPANVLQQKLEVDDVFSIKPLMDHTCPFTSLPDWMPRDQPRHPTYDPFIWYEHVSKAGGTSFCKTAEKNMPRFQIPPYYCMPRDYEDYPNDPDGRVGLWTNEKFRRYRLTNPNIRLVSNEWHPFPEDRWALPNDDRLITVTTIRHPLDRLLSAYQFWGVTTNRAEDKPTLVQFLNRRLRLSNSAPPDSRGIAFHVGRYNYIAWKFSNGTMPGGVLVDEIGFPGPWQGDEWVKPFQRAALTLAKFHLVIILELSSDSIMANKTSQVLGWKQSQQVHTVNIGHAMNTNARSQLSTDEYNRLWEGNRWDVLLYEWIKAVDLTRWHCSGLMK